MPVRNADLIVVSAAGYFDKDFSFKSTKTCCKNKSEVVSLRGHDNLLKASEMKRSTADISLGNRDE